MTTETSYEVLWHQVRVEAAPGADSAALRRIGSQGLPDLPRVTCCYRIANAASGWTVEQDGDWLANVSDPAHAWAIVDERVAARAVELAVRRGWMPFSATALDIDGALVCLLGPAAKRDPVAQMLVSKGAGLESADCVLVSQGQALGVALRDWSVTTAGRVRPLDRFLIYGGTADSAEPMRALIDAAGSMWRRPAGLIRDIASLLSASDMPAAPISEQWTKRPGWYVLDSQRVGY